MRKKTIIFLVFIILVVSFSGIIFAQENTNNSDKIKYPYLFPAKVLSDLTNEIYNHFKDNIEQENTQNIKNVDMSIFIEIGKKLLVMFFVAGMFVELDRFEKFSVYTFIRAFVIFSIAYIMIENYSYIFEITRNIKNFLFSNLSLTTQDKIIDFEIVNKQFELALQNEGVVDNMLLVYTTIVYTLITYSIFLAIILVYLILVIRQFKLFILQLLAPIMLSGLGSIHTFSFTIKYIKKYLKVYLQIFFIQFVISIYLTLSISSTNLLFVLLQSGLLIVSLVLGRKFISFSFAKFKNGFITAKHRTKQTIRYAKNKVKAIKNK